MFLVLYSMICQQLLARTLTWWWQRLP